MTDISQRLVLDIEKKLTTSPALIALATVKGTRWLAEQIAAVATGTLAASVAPRDEPVVSAGELEELAAALKDCRPSYMEVHCGD